MDEKTKAFYEYHATFMEPWDGPASVAFTDGKFIDLNWTQTGVQFWKDLAPIIMDK